MCVCVLFWLGVGGGWQLSLTFGNSLGVGIFHLGQGQLIGNITLLKCQNAHRLSLNINRTTSRLKINPNWVELHAISFSLMHISTARNKENRARGSNAIKLYLYHTKSMSIILTWLFPSELIRYCYNYNDIIYYWQTKARQKSKSFVILQRESCGQ